MKQWAVIFYHPEQDRMVTEHYATEEQATQVYGALITAPVSFARLTVMTDAGVAETVRWWDGHRDTTAFPYRLLTQYK